MTKHQDLENHPWPAQFERLHGRRLRVLHIGNVANNAYLNAKILNEQGVDCDVVCADYYHIMACPEWEDADFAGNFGDQFFPDWEAVDVRGFRRPRWFAQGPMRCCIAYLSAKRRGRRLAARIYWTYLRARRWYTCSPRLHGVRSTVNAVRAGWLGRVARRLRRGAAWAACLAAAIARRARRADTECREDSGLSTQYAVHSTQYAVHRTQYAVLGRTPDVTPMGEGTNGSFPRRIRELVAEFADVFPERADRLTSADLVRNRTACLWWTRLLRHYDVVVGYAVEGKWPLLAGARPYFAYEHGTIRNIPFEDNEQGRVCAITYRLADGVFITTVSYTHLTLPTILRV